jgi:hypothetical protein
VLDTIFKTNVSTVDLLGHFLDVAGIGFHVQVVAFPEPAGALCSTFKCGQVFCGFFRGDLQAGSKVFIVALGR